MPRVKKCDQKLAKAADAANLAFMLPKTPTAYTAPKDTENITLPTEGEGHGAAGPSRPKRSAVVGKLNPGKAELKQHQQQKLEQQRKEMLQKQVQQKLMQQQKLLLQKQLEQKQKQLEQNQLQQKQKQLEQDQLQQKQKQLEKNQLQQKQLQQKQQQQKQQQQKQQQQKQQQQKQQQQKQFQQKLNQKLDQNGNHDPESQDDDEDDDDEAAGGRKYGSMNDIEQDNLENVNVSLDDDTFEQPEEIAVEPPELSELERYKKELEDLQSEVKVLRSFNYGLQHKVVMEENSKLSFTEVEGYPDKGWLLNAHVQADESDYVFVKLMMVQLFPQGVGNATPTGNSSPNPSGKGKNAADYQQPAAPRDRIDPAKMEYMAERLRERRMLFLESPALAAVAARMINHHVTRVICNNRKMRL